MRVICITGIDGSGKTTLARNLAAALRQRGLPAAYFYGRIVPLISRLLMALGRAAFLRDHDPWRDYAAYNGNKVQTMRRPILKGIYTAAIYVDAYTQIWLKLIPHVFSRRVIVLDRYVYDTVISDLAVHLSYSQAQADAAIQRGLRLLPSPVVTFLLDLPEEVAFSRKDDVPHLDYLRERRTRYLELACRPEVEMLDGERSPGDLLQDALVKFAALQAGVCAS